MHSLEYTYCKDGTATESLVLLSTYWKNNYVWKKTNLEIILRSKLFYEQQFVRPYRTGKCILAQNSKFSRAGEAGGPSGSLKYIFGTCSDMPKKTLGTALT